MPPAASANGGSAAPTVHPTSRASDEWYGFLNQGDAHFYYPLKIWENDHELSLPENRGLRKNGTYGDTSKGTYIHDQFTDRALRFIDKHQKQPFFVYLPYTVPHTELVVPEDSLAQYKGRWKETPYRDKHGRNASGRKFYDGYAECNVRYPRATYAAMISRMDRDIGRIVARLRMLDLADNTLVVFASDNGPAKTGGGYDAEFFNGADPLHWSQAQFSRGRHPRSADRLVARQNRSRGGFRSRLLLS